MSGVISAVVAGGVALTEGGIKIANGISQKKQAALLAKENPFIAQTMPGAVTQATNLAAQNYTNGMPGMPAAQQGIQQQAGNAYAAASKGASSSGDLLDAANKIGTGAQSAQLQLAQQAASYKSNALGGYAAALGNEAGWQDQLYKNTQLQPYLRAANTAAALQGAGNINEFNGLDTIGSGLETAAGSYSNSQYKNLLLKNLNKGNGIGFQPGSTITDPNMAAASMGMFDSPTMPTNQMLAQSQIYQG